MSIKMKNRRFGYIRVSSRNQNEGRQLQSMQEVGFSPAIFSLINKIEKIQSRRVSIVKTNNS